MDNAKQPAPGSGRVERKKEEARQKIIDVAMQLFVDQGVDSTTMEQIAEEVDIAKGTLYNYFPVKEAIIAAYIERSFMNKNAARIEQLRALPDTRARLTRVLNELTEGIQGLQEIFERFLVYQMQKVVSLRKSDVEKSGVGDLGAEIIDLGRESGEIRGDLPVSFLSDMFDFLFIEVVKQFYLEPCGFEREKVIDQCVDAFMNGVRPRG